MSQDSLHGLLRTVVIEQELEGYPGLGPGESKKLSTLETYLITRWHAQKMTLRVGLPYLFAKSK